MTTEQRTGGNPHIEMPYPSIPAHNMLGRDRMRLAKAELLLHLAIKTSSWARQCRSTEQGIRPFAEFDADDPLVELCRTYALTPEQLARALDQLGDELEGRALRAGYDEHLDPVPPPTPSRGATR